MVSRELFRSSIPVLLSGLMLAACGAPEEGLAPSEEALGTQESAMCSGASVSTLSILGVSSYFGEVAGSGSWAVTSPANAVHLDFYVDGVLRATQELNSGTRAGDWNFSYIPVYCGSHTFEVRAYPMTIDSSNNVTRCPTSGTQSKSKSFTEGDCPRVTYYRPTQANSYGYRTEIWQTTTNGNRYCQERGYTMLSYTLGCGKYESSYMTFNGTSWVSQSSGSTNQCYNIFDTITCT